MKSLRVKCNAGNFIRILVKEKYLFKSNTLKQIEKCKCYGQSVIGGEWEDPGPTSIHRFWDLASSSRISETREPILFQDCLEVARSFQLLYEPPRRQGGANFTGFGHGWSGMNMLVICSVGRCCVLRLSLPAYGEIYNTGTSHLKVYLQVEVDYNFEVTRLQLQEMYPQQNIRQQFATDREQ